MLFSETRGQGTKKYAAFSHRQGHSFHFSFLFFCSDDLDAYATEPSVDVRDLGVRSRWPSGRRSVALSSARLQTFSSGQLPAWREERCQEGWRPWRDVPAADTLPGELVVEQPRCCCCCCSSSLYLHRRRRRLHLLFHRCSRAQNGNYVACLGFNSLPASVCSLIVAAAAPPSVMEVALSRDTSPPLRAGECELAEQSH